MKLMGIDYGTKRTGVALSDDGGVIAFPHDTLDTKAGLLNEIAKLAEERGVGAIVIGDGKNAKDKMNSVETVIQNFKTDLEEIVEIPVVLVGEMFSSFEAHGRLGKERNDARKTKIQKGENVDAKAAAVILQRYIDIIRNRPKADQAGAGA